MMISFFTSKEIPKFVTDPSDMPKCEQLGYTQIKESAGKGMEIFIKKLKEGSFVME